MVLPNLRMNVICVDEDYKTIKHRHLYTYKSQVSRVVSIKPACIILKSFQNKVSYRPGSGGTNLPMRFRQWRWMSFSVYSLLLSALILLQVLNAALSLAASLVSWCHFDNILSWGACLRDHNDTAGKSLKFLMCYFLIF